MSIAEKLTQIAENQEKVYDAGKQAEYDCFWDAFQQNGNRTNYFQQFMQLGWTDETFKPKYPIVCRIVNAWDTSCANSVFYNARMTKILVPISVTGVTMIQTFYNCTALEMITLLTLNDVTGFTDVFAYCGKLKNITIGGSIDVNISFANSNLLTTVSVQSIIDHLKDLTGATTQTLTLHATVGAKLTDAQKATIAAKNWEVKY